MSKKADQVANTLTILAPGDCVRVNSCAPLMYQGKAGRVLEKLQERRFDYIVSFEDDDCFFFADELELVNES